VIRRNNPDESFIIYRRLWGAGGGAYTGAGGGTWVGDANGFAAGAAEMIGGCQRCAAGCAEPIT